MQADVQDRLTGALGAAIVLGAVFYLLIVGLAVHGPLRTAQPEELVALPPERPAEPKPPASHPAPASARASPRNLKNEPAAVVVPSAVLQLPAPILLAAATPGQASATSAGTSDRPGSGEGSGGEGDGNGRGEGEDDGGDTPPRQIKGRLKISDLPADLRAANVVGTVSVRYDVAIDGAARDCKVSASSGSAELDQLTCRLIEQRFRFAPSHDRDGRPVDATIEEDHRWVAVPAPTGH